MHNYKPSLFNGIKIVSAGRLYSTFRSNLSKKFQFWGSYTLVVAPMGVKFGVEVPSSMPKDDMEEGRVEVLLAWVNPTRGQHCEIWHGGGDLGSPPPCQISPHRCNVLPLRGEKPQNRPLSKLNTDRLALRAMLSTAWVDPCQQPCHIISTLNFFSCYTLNFWATVCQMVRPML